MIIFFKKLWTWVKKYWRVLALITGAIIGFVLLRGKVPSFAADFRKIDEAYQEELRKIEEAREEERRLRAAADARLTETLKKVEEEYQAQQKELDRKKKKEIEKIVKEAGEDPEELARRLSEATGFKVILPKD